MTISASVSSGNPVAASSRRSTNFIFAGGMLTLGFSTCAVFPACASAGRNTFGRSVATHGSFAHDTFDTSFPA